MAPFLSKRSSRRRPADLTLRATEPDAEPTVALDGGAEPLPVGWAIAAAIAGLLVAGVGWVVIVGLTVVGWLAVDAATAAGSLRGTLVFGTQLWVYANGAGLAGGGLHVTLVPWGAIAFFAFLLARCVAFAAARTCRRGPGSAAGSAAGEEAGPAGPSTGSGREPAGSGREPAGSGRGLARSAVGIAVVATISYLAPLAAVALLVGAPAVNARMILAPIALLGAALWASCRALGVDPTAALPRWLRPVPTAVLGTQLVLLVSGAAVLISGMLVQLDRVIALDQALGAGVAGNIPLLLAQLAFVPNAMVWGAAYALGAGFGLGDGSVVAPAATQVGLLPGVPLFGAVPGSGPGGIYSLLWLGAGVLAGLVAAWLVVRRRPAARFDETALVGGLSGVVGACVFAGLAWATSGDLGLARLTGLGPRLPELVVMAVSTLGLSGMIGGLVLGLWRGRPRDEVPTEVEEDDADPEATVHLDREKVLTGSG